MEEFQRGAKYNVALLPHLMLVLVLSILRYCRMSGTVISLRALRNLSPIQFLLR